MRHGQTLYLGHDCPAGLDLTEEGRRQAEAAAEVFRGLRLDLAVASPLCRAMGTARIVTAHHQGLVVEPTDDLREITPQPSADMDLAQIFSQVIEFFSNPRVTWDTPFVGGETFREVHGRVMGFLGTLLARPGWSTALAVAHGGANMALIAGVLGLAEGEIPRIEQDLGCINAIDFDADGRGMVRLVNFSAHDPLKARQREPSSVQLRRAFEERGWSVPPGRGLAGDGESSRGGPAR
jgi:broad specificity phosphatase PhoE